MRLILLLALSLLLTPLTAQITSGTIDYNERYSFKFGNWRDIKQRKEMEKRMAAGDFDKTGRLTFDTTAFSYTMVKTDRVQGGRRWRIEQRENPDINYVNIADSTVTDRRNVMDRTFIMEGDWIVPEWNIANRKVGMKEIPLPNQLASAVSVEGDTLLAYFTPSIPLPIGPKGYGGLPGAIVYLKVSNNGTSREYTMTTMQPNAPDVELVKPTGDDVITREEFKKIQKRTREMMERRHRNWDRGRE